MNYPAEQDEYDWLVECWNQFERRRFPRRWAGVDIDGICLVMLDADIAGHVQSYVQRRSLKPGGLRHLQDLQQDLRLILPALNGEAADYFRELDRLTAVAIGLLTKFQ